MKLYDAKISPNCRRVRMVLAEKGVVIPSEECFDSERASLREDFLARYPFRLVPMLELDDGTQIGESTAICRYIEELYPEPNLFGRTPLERATIEMWHQRVDNQGEAAAEEAFRNSFPPFAERALAGSAEPVLQIPPLVGRGRASLGRFLQMLERQLSAAPFIAGGRFTMADISALCACDMGKIAGVELPQNFSHLRTWYDSIAQRPSARA